MFNALEPWHIIVLAVVLIALFGYKRLPAAARGLGQSMRIFRSEAKQMRNEGDESADGQQQPPQAFAQPQQYAQPQFAAPQQLAPPQPVPPAQPMAQPVAQPVAQPYAQPVQQQVPAAAPAPAPAEQSQQPAATPEQH
ncbi:MAG TPA: Sec-independent protein translocase subunit TatA [Pseudonocardiaceae bacterium]